MIITDLKGKKRNIKNAKKIYNKEMDVVSNEIINVPYAEVTVIGKSGEWKQWYPLEEFKKINPDVKI